MIFALSTLLLVETVAPQDETVLPPQPQAGNLRGGDLANKLSGAVADADLDELKTLRKDKSMNKFKQFVDDQLLNKKIEVIEERLEKEFEEKLNEYLSTTTTTAPGLSVETEAKLVADELLDEAIDEANMDPKLAKVEKVVEHFIVNEVVDSLAERKKKAEAGEEVNEEEENKTLTLKITADIMGMLKDVPADQKVGIEETVKNAVAEAVESNMSTKEGGPRALQLGRTALEIAKVAILPPLIAPVVETAYNVAQSVVVNNQDAFSAIANTIDSAIGIGPIFSTGWNIFSTLMFR